MAKRIAAETPISPEVARRRQTFANRSVIAMLTAKIAITCPLNAAGDRGACTSFMRP